MTLREQQVLPVDGGMGQELGGSGLSSSFFIRRSEICRALMGLGRDLSWLEDSRNTSFLGPSQVGWP